MTLVFDNNREQQRHHFLKQQGYDPLHHRFLAGDASPRRYYRWENQGLSLILMDSPLTEKPEEFSNIAELLSNIGLSAPTVIAKDIEQGFLLLEDLGDETYTKALTSDNAEDLYLLAIDTLIHLHQNLREKPAFIQDYTVAGYLREALLLLDWYYPALYQREISNAARRTYEQIWSSTFEMALTQQPHSLVLRDYHVDNLILIKDRPGYKRCGVLDFQDALWGPVGYDIVSLLEDARRDVNFSIKQQAWERYAAAFPDLDLTSLKQSSAVISAGRHAKIIGIFTRLAVRDHKPHYLHHLPRVWRLLETSLVEANLSELAQWFEEHIPEWRVPKNAH